MSPLSGHKIGLRPSKFVIAINNYTSLVYRDNSVHLLCI